MRNIYPLLFNNINTATFLQSVSIFILQKFLSSFLKKIRRIRKKKKKKYYFESFHFNVTYTKVINTIDEDRR